MNTHVLLHLNLLNTDEETRDAMYALMQAEKWKKGHPAFTSWTCFYNDGPEGVAEAVVDEIKRLAAKAGVPKLYGVAQCGNAAAIDFAYRAAPRLTLGRY